MWGSGCRVSDFGFGRQGLGGAGFGFRFEGSGCRVGDFKFRVSGVGVRGFRVRGVGRHRAEGRGVGEVEAERVRSAHLLARKRAK